VRLIACELARRFGCDSKSQASVLTMVGGSPKPPDREGQCVPNSGVEPAK
jgi:hypothetical protein